MIIEQALSTILTTVAAAYQEQMPVNQSTPYISWRITSADRTYTMDKGGHGLTRYGITCTIFTTTAVQGAQLKGALIAALEGWDHEQVKGAFWLGQGMDWFEELALFGVTAGFDIHYSDD